MIIYNSKIPKWLGYKGMAIYPFIFISYSCIDCPARVIKHEKIHIKQQLKWLIIPFFIVYGLDYIVGRIKGLNHDEAYRDIRFEKEAYGND